MIPVLLKLSNFTSYGTNVPELDFTKFKMAAISGQNGAGKSSLLDSITWCLWGNSRLGDSSDQLIRLGETEMLVEFSFELDSSVYTVKRKRLLKSGGTTSLELFSNSHNLTEGTIRSTQQKIVDLLRLSYETFTNSAFLRQGHADEFTTKGPTDRKRILADILGLSHYDLLEEKAKDKAKQTQVRLQALDYQLIEIEAELSQKDQREKQLSEAENEAQKAKAELSGLEQLIKQIDKMREIVSTKYQFLSEKQQRIEVAKREQVELDLQISQKLKSREENQQILDKRPEIEEGLKKLNELKSQQQQLDSKRSELIKVKDELVVLQRNLQDRKNKRDKEVSSLDISIKQLETINDQKQQQINHLKSHKDSCPTCGQAIGEEKNQQIIVQNDQLIKQNSQNIQQFLTKRQKYLDYTFPETQQIKHKDLQRLTLEQETKPWELLLRQLNECEKYGQLNLKLTQADASIKAHEEAILDLKKIYDQKQQQIEEERLSLEFLEVYRNQLLEMDQKLQAQTVIKTELSQKAMQLQAQVGEARQLVSRAKQLEDRRVQKGQERKILQDEKQAFEELAQAFGKKGIQAMIIETAIPEIEEESNELLSRLTEGRLKIRLDTQRETKTKVGGEKGTVETLDIIISDEMGERVYEAYSGGEQFRINLAIRLSLSKLLTHRAGSKLQFLVIDEGFGTQDVQGISRIVETISAIKDDFEKILIITHLDELKEEFPVRIEVSKTPDGSTFEVVSS